jgi:hypothetical protein
VFRGSEATARSIVEHGQCSPTVSGLNRQVVAVVPSRDLAEAARVARTGMVPGAFFTFRLACLAREGVAEVTALIGICAAPSCLAGLADQRRE